MENYDKPAIIATEFGVEKRDGEPYAEPDIIPSGPVGLEIDDWQRLKWHYDMRTVIEDNNSAWTVFGFTSTWGMTGRFIYLERFNLNDNPIYHRSNSRNPNYNGSSDYFDPNIIQALFGDSRPNGDGVDD